MTTETSNNARNILVDHGVSPSLLNIMSDGASVMENVCHRLADQAGWWDDFAAGHEAYRRQWIAAKLALVHSEVSEALEGHRKGKMDEHLPHRTSFEVELADAVIRIFDLAGGLGADVAGAIIEKLAYNTQRADHKREARAAEGGKAY